MGNRIISDILNAFVVSIDQVAQGFLEELAHAEGEGRLGAQVDGSVAFGHHVLELASFEVKNGDGGYGIRLNSWVVLPQLF